VLQSGIEMPFRAIKTNIANSPASSKSSADQVDAVFLKYW
jgi:hypothetical protein